MSSHRCTPALAVSALGMGLLAASAAIAHAQQGRKPDEPAGASAIKAEDRFASLDALNTYYDEQLTALDKRRIADLTRLAGKTSGAEAEAAYQELFNLAIARNAYEDAAPAAENYLKASPHEDALRSLATLVHVIALGSRKQDEESIKALRDFLKRAQVNQKLDPGAVMAVGEAYLQRLVRWGRYDTARQVSELFISGYPDPKVKEHFNARLARLDRLGKPAPRVEGTDIDGQKVSLAELKGKVVLVNFWATWCPPCVAAIPHLNALASKYGKQGFEIVGVNLDNMRQNVRDPSRGLPLVRRFLVDFRVNWPNLINAPGPNDYARAFGVIDIPANFLIDRDGKIVHFELSGEELDKAIAQELGEGRPDADGKKAERSGR